MRLVIDMKYLQRTKSGIRYRREIPGDLQGPLGAKWFTEPLGETEKDAARNWKTADNAFQKLVSDQRRLLRQPSELELYRMAQERIRRWGFDPEFDRGAANDSVAMAEEEARGLAALEILDQYPVNAHTGEPQGVSKIDLAVVKALYNGMPARPMPTFDEAQRLYVSEKVTGNALEIKKNTQRVERVAKRLKAALGKYPRLDRISREDAKSVRDYMLSQSLAPSSVRRELNIVKAVINHAITELELADCKNPFNKLDIPGLYNENDNLKRSPFPPELLKAVRTRVLNHCNNELTLIWRLLEGTGCRLAEITGLRVEDVSLTGNTPNIKVTWHEKRRVKTTASKRRVPLVGDALEAAREAVKAAKGRPILFADYGTEIGPTNASASLMKQVRKITDDPLLVIHSLRHNTKDRLDVAGVTPAVRDMILGHSSGGVGDRFYGGEDAKLIIATEAMRKAYGELSGGLDGERDLKAPHDNHQT